MIPSPRSIALIIPAYNAASTLGELINRIRAAVGDIPIIVVDDGSIDGTSEVATGDGITTLRHEQNRGKGAALQTGFNFFKNRCENDFILTMDSDLQHQPEDIPGFLDVQQQTQADIVIGWRQRIGSKMPLHRVLSNTITSSMVRMRTGVKVLDSQCGFRLIRRRVIDQIKLESIGYEAETEFLIKAARAGYKIEFVPTKTIYGNERSYMTHWTTTKNFIKVLFRDYP